MNDEYIGMIAGAVIVCLFLLAMAVFFCATARADDDLWKITAYCACKECCGPNAKGIMANGEKVEIGAVACNVLPFGTVLIIPDIKNVKLSTFPAYPYIVKDRGSHRLFDGQKHIDIYIPDHEWARQFGVQYSRVFKLNTEQI